MRTLLLLISFLISLPAIAQDKFDTYRFQFVGTWRVATDKRVTTVIWNKDGTWSSKTIDDGKELWSLKGVWWTMDGKLHGVLLESSDPQIPKGEDEPSKVVDVTADYYVIENWRGVLKKYEKVK